MHNLDPPYAHNDVKPGNVLITHRKGQPPLAILMDFGSARPAKRQIRSRSEALQLQVLVCHFLLSFFNNHYA
jgi:serine/threonine kinase 16